MKKVNEAKILSAQDLRDMINMECHNPTVERLVFIETKGKGNEPGKVFPCYVYAWAIEEHEAPERDWLMFQADIIQHRSGEFGILQVYLHEKEFGVNKRIWDEPPTDELRNSLPFIEEVVQ